ALFMRDQRESGMRLPEIGAQVDRLAVGSNGTPKISVGVQGDAHIVVSVGVVAFPSQRLGERVDRGAILATRVQAEPEKLVSLGILRIHAERGAGFGDR